MNLILGHPSCKTCQHQKLVHRLGLGVCEEPGCKCMLYLSGQYEPDKPPRLMGQPGKPKRERIKKPSKSGETLQVPIESLLCTRCKHYQTVHEVAETSDSEGGRCKGFGCECWEFTTNPADENNFDQLGWVDLEHIEPERVSVVAEPANSHCTIEQVDMINHPPHYTNHPSGVECISITEHMNFCIGNAVKYLWRADLKGGLEDLEKALWYVQREIERRKGASA